MIERARYWKMGIDVQGRGVAECLIFRLHRLAQGGGEAHVRTAPHETRLIRIVRTSSSGVTGLRWVHLGRPGYGAYLIEWSWALHSPAKYVSNPGS